MSNPPPDARKVIAGTKCRCETCCYTCLEEADATIAALSAAGMEIVAKPAGMSAREFLEASGFNKAAVDFAAPAAPTPPGVLSEAEIAWLATLYYKDGSPISRLIDSHRALSAECFKLAAYQCQYPSTDEYGNQRCAEIDRLTAPVGDCDYTVEIKWLRHLSDEGGKGAVDNVDARALGRIADALWRLSRELDEARRAYHELEAKTYELPDIEGPE